MGTRRWLIAAALAAGCGSGSTASDLGADLAPTGPITLSGAVQKGPFVLGSSISVSPVDDHGNPTGQVFKTETTDDLGDFSLDIVYQGHAAIEGVGYYYNEVTGMLSASSLTLRAFYDVGLGAQSAYVNLITHLAYARVKTLLTASGTDFAAAVTQAETELRTALTVGGPSFDPKASGVQMNLLGGDNNADAYEFAVSSIMAQIAKDSANGASVDATLQELINTTASSFAAGGTLDAGLVAKIRQVQIDVAPKTIMDLLQARLTSLQSTAVVPDLNRVWDTDGDGVPNAIDNCPFLPNPSQAPPDGSAGYHDDGTGTCVVNGCATGFHDGGLGTCLPVGTCSTNFHDGGDGICIAVGTCANGFHLAAAGACASNFAGAVNYPIGASPQQLVAGDFDGDGALDLASANYGAHTVSVLLGKGDGTFQTAADFAACPTCGGVSSGPRDLVVANIDSDGKLDLYAVNDNSVAALLGAAAGTFSTPSTIVGSGSGTFEKIALADFNGDTHSDIAVSSETLPSVDITLINTNGTPGTSSAIATMAGQYGAVTGDFDKDGHADVMALDLNNGIVEVALGKGDGTFQPNQTLLTGTGDAVYCAATGDLDGDGKLDAVIIGYGVVAKMNFYAVLLGKGDGTFTVAKHDSPVSTDWVVLGDVDGDSHLDLIISAGPSVAVALGNGDGTFKPFETFATDVSCGPVVVGDFDGDKKLDLAVACAPSSSTGSVSILLNRL